MTPRIRCAIYTRKSSEEGLEQSFNSLDAQREACEAFIRSQMHEGWIALGAKYDDGGFSGGNMDRPALKRLMEDIAAGKVNTVVVYKVDRLTRSLADFAKIIEQFDARGVNFVSVTQQFNTTTSMGRLTLNVLLSFAQFEREVTGERIRDKIAASKAKGMWMGGRVPVGYDLRERRLYINAKEAEQVREIFSQYLQLRSVSALMAYLRQSGIRTKVRTFSDGKNTGGGFYSRGALYEILRNHLYIGEIAHKGSVYEGQHEAILDRETWDRVQQLLSDNQQGTRGRPRASSGSLLTGLIFDEAGNRYIPTHTQKRGRRYHYYTSQAVIRGERNDEVIGRLPAAAIEIAVANRLLDFFRSPSELLTTFKRLDSPEVDLERLLKRAEQRATGWNRTPLPAMGEFIRKLLHRVIVHRSELELQIDLESAVDALLDNLPQDYKGRKHISVYALPTPICLAQSGRPVMKMVIGKDKASATTSREAIAKAIARARSWHELIVQGKAVSLVDIAQQQRVTPRYVKNIFPLAFLGPQAVELLLKGDEQDRPLASLLGKVPMLWNEQLVLLR